MSHDPKKKLVGIIALGISILLVAYVLFQAKNLILGPRLTISEPRDGMHLTNELVTITGVAKNVSAISLNDNPIFVDKEGVFREKLIAAPGYSIIKMSVEDRFGRKKTEYIHLVFNSEKERGPFMYEMATTSSTTSTSVSTSTQPLPAASTTNQSQ